MSLVLCDVTPDQILFLGDSASPTENTDLQNYPKDAIKVLGSPDGRIGIGLAGTLNLRWQNIYTQPFKWIGNFLQQANPDQTKNLAVLVQALKEQIEALRGMPFNDLGIIMIGGFSDGQPQIYELEVKSKSAEVTNLKVSVNRLEDFNVPRVLSFGPTWIDLLSLSGVSRAQIPAESIERHKCFREIMKQAVEKLIAAGEHKVATPIVSISIQKPKIAVLGWGSLISKPEGDTSIGQKPLLISGHFVTGGPSLPIEFSRISQDGRLTLVIDPLHGTPCDTLYAFSLMPDLATASQNMAEREGTPIRNIHFASRGETYTDEIRNRIAAWLIQKSFDAAVWTGLPPKFQFEDFEKFSIEAAIAYLSSLTGTIREKAFDYITTAPPTVRTPVRERAMKLLASLQSNNHLVVMERETTINGLFSHADISFSIPSYQRAYAWETTKDRKQVVQFLDDLKEHPRMAGQRKSYFLGHFLFEREESKPTEFLVIDGQQRLTTAVIFFHCLGRELMVRRQGGERLQTADGGEVDLELVRRTFVTDDDGSRKMRTIDYDDDLFRSLLQGVSSPQPKTRSGERLMEATELMSKRMQEEKSTAELIRWMELVETAVVTTFEVNNKEQATQIFAFQNDRGKDLTNLEKLKAFLMHMVYVHSSVKVERESINDVERKFADIYRLAEEIETLKEDQVLAFHLTAFVAWTDNPVELLKKELRTKGTGPQKVEWIRASFCTTLVESFKHVTEIERLSKGSNLHERLIGDVLHLHAWASWPLLLKLLHFHARELPRVAEVLKLMEITLFKLQFMKGKSTNRLPDIANEYQGHVEALETRLKHISQHGFHDHWDFNGEFRRFLDGSDHYDHPTRYLLWKYENDVRATKPGVHHLPLQEYLNQTEGQNLDGSIEHIMPQNPETLVHSEVFSKDFLHNLGNLVLMTRGRNSSLKNKLPREKAEALKLTPYLTHQTVVETILKQGWGEAEIIERKRLIVEFALRYWRVGEDALTQQSPVKARGTVTTTA